MSEALARVGLLHEAARGSCRWLRGSTRPRPPASWCSGSCSRWPSGSDRIHEQWGKAQAGAQARGIHIGPCPFGYKRTGVPNDHVRFDTGGIIVLDDLAIVDTATGSTVGRLRTVHGHVVDTAQLAYHRERFGPSHATQSI